MSIRHVVKTVAACGAATICGVALVISLGSGVAGASLVSSDGNTTLNTIGTVTAGTPYSSGQTIQVSVAANSVIDNANLAAANQGGLYYLEECTDSEGSSSNLPTGPSNCEAATLTTISKTTSGAFNKNVTVYDLPDPGTLGSATMTGICDKYPNDCVIGIFVASPQSAGTYALPHLFSAPFQVDQQSDFGSGAEAGLNPGDGTPEVPLAIGLPLLGIALFGGWTLVRNRRRRQQTAGQPAG
jgi:hypothetical protein